MKVSILGPSGSYTEKAADELFSSHEDGALPEYVYRPSIEGVVLDLFSDSEPSALALIPVENSTEGAVGISMDLLLEKDVSVLAEIILPVNHCLFVSKETASRLDFSLGGIGAVYSHPQGLYQCRTFIRDKLKNARLVETDSTSKAALIVFESSENGRPEMIAGIASPEAGEKYGLHLVSSSIQDNLNNSTRFFILSRLDSSLLLSDSGLPRPDFIQPATEMTAKEASVPVLSPGRLERVKDGAVYAKTSIIITPQNDRPGALFHILEAFYRQGLNLTRIESRPSKRALGEYHFYIDFEGEETDQKVKDALRQITEQSSRLKILGTYGRISAASGESKGK
ncbi:MAG: prephenate dehydratase [Methanimicrococcus sp.]|nr:prephenate dehydratase [Methanimicrococcus sp.]